jgi:hypothetical protein
MGKPSGAAGLMAERCRFTFKSPGGIS